MQEEFSWTHPNGMQVKRLPPERVKHLYDGHEVASHTLTHPYMHELSDEEL
jgi:peptidoglycan/xylan/chitin deacetylase (PgdA/CDA1 family)